MEQKNNDLASFISDGNHDNIDVERENDKHAVTASDYENKPSVSRLPFYGDAMNESNVNELVDDVVPSVFVLIGFPKYGKSTFVSSFYHVVMREGKIGKYKFLDSETLAGFERRSHIRNAEIVAKKRLDRTPIYADYFLSMLFENTVTHEYVKIVISDRSGEVYHNYAAKKASLESDKLLATKCHLIYFLDSEVLASYDSFIGMRNDIDNLSKQMNKLGLFDNCKTYEVVYNKADKLEQNSELKADFDSSSPLIEGKLEGYCKLRKKIKVSSLNPLRNNGLKKYFEEMLDECSTVKCAENELLDKMNWTHNI